MPDGHFVNNILVWQEPTFSQLVQDVNNRGNRENTAISMVNDFYCGLHFEVELAESADADLIQQEKLKSKTADSKTANIGMTAEPGFRHWNHTHSQT